MPTYHYRCKSCAHEFDQFQKFSEDPLTVCPECGQEIRRVIQPVGVARGFTAGGGRVGTSLHLLGLEHLAVGIDFTIELVLDRVFPRQIAPKDFDPVPQEHSGTSLDYVVSSALDMAATMRSHCAVSSLSWRRPAFVSW